MQARKGPVGPLGSTEHVGPVGLLWRGARESYRTGGYKPVRTPLGYEVGLNLPHRTCASAPPLVPGGGTNR